MKAQVSLEFIMVMSFAALFLVALLTVGADQLIHAVDNKALSETNDVALVIQQETVTAASVQDGYTRNFTLPLTISNVPYTITPNSTANITVFTIHTVHYTTSIRSPFCNGTFSPGPNFIRKNNNTLWCNQ